MYTKTIVTIIVITHYFGFIHVHVHCTCTYMYTVCNTCTCIILDPCIISHVFVLYSTHVILYNYYKLHVHVFDTHFKYNVHVHVYSTTHVCYSIFSYVQHIQVHSEEYPAEASCRAHMHGKNRYKNITACRP